MGKREREKYPYNIDLKNNKCRYFSNEIMKMLELFYRSIADKTKNLGK